MPAKRLSRSTPRRERCDSPGEVDERYAELAADGLGLRAPFDAFWGQRYATVRDPDGTRIDLYAPLEKS